MTNEEQRQAVRKAIASLLEEDPYALDTTYDSLHWLIDQITSIPTIAILDADQAPKEHPATKSIEYRIGWDDCTTAHKAANFRKII